MNDLKRGVDWAKLRAQTAKAHVRKLLAERSRTTVTTAAGIGAVFCILVLSGFWVWLYAGLPRVPDAETLWSMNRRPGMTFLDRNGAMLGVRGPYYGHAVTLANLPPHVPQAFLAIEDQRFYEHGGVDQQAMARATLANVLSLHTVQGASTITQQLCKNLFLTPDRTMRRKLQEIILAGRVERKLNKDQIFELYLNRVYLGDQAYGIDAASRRFFGHPATQLTLPEAALLAGLPKAPSRSTPTENLDRALARQRVVLNAMVNSGDITQAEADEAARTPIHVVGDTPASRDLGYVFDLAADQARKVAGDRGKDMVIRLTIDLSLQDAAGKAVHDGLGAAANAKRPLQAALVSLDQDGAVRALIGGTSYAKSKFNRAVQARRQPGSAFKAFVYAAAFEQGFEPDTVRYDEPIMINGWQPKNYYETYRGAVTLRTAFAQSLNTVAAEVANEIGPARVAELARRFGIASPLSAVPSLALGSSEVTLYELTQAFSTFMREGAKTDAYLLVSVQNSKGDSLYQHPEQQPQQVYDIELADRMNSMLGRVVQAGTGTRARIPGRDVAGKTGTSQDYRDAWFVGYTADFTTGVWVGYDDHSAMSKVSGGTMPAAIFAQYMGVAQAHLPARPIPGIYAEPPPSDAPALVNFYDALSSAFGNVLHEMAGGEDKPPPAEVGQ